MIRRLLRGAVALGACTALVLVSSGCSTTLRDAATISYEDDDGQHHTIHIRRDDFEDQVEELQQDENLVAVLSQRLPIDTMPAGQADPDLTATWLNILIQSVAIEQEFESLGLELTDEQLQTTVDQVAQGFGDVPSLFIEKYARVTAQANAIFDALAEETKVDPPTEADIRAYWDDNEDAITACPSGKEVAHILVDDEVTANQLAAQLAAGADFAALADANSTDTRAQAGGSLGCLDNQPYGGEFADAAAEAELGTPTAPVTTDAGTHLILVTPWQPTFEKFRDRIADALQQQAEAQAQQESQRRANEAVVARLEALDVRVDPRYGTWGFDENSQAWQVTPPVPPSPRTEREARLAPQAARNVTREPQQ